MRNLINKFLVKKSILENNLVQEEEDRVSLFETRENHETARALIQRAAEITQERLAYHLSDLVSLALKSVFGDTYKFQAKFVSKRGSTECELLFIDDKGNEFHPLQSCGYGIADIASVALRIVFWSLGNSRPILFFDEPFRFVSKNYITKASEMVKSLSEELKIQIICITHIEELASAADKTFSITQKKGISQVEVM